MKKKLLFVFLMILLILPINVFADTIKKLDMKIYLDNKGYNITGLLLAHFRIKLHRKKYYCSEFVYEVLSNNKVKVLDNTKTLFKPEELIENKNYNKIFEGKIKDYIAIC